MNWTESLALMISMVFFFNIIIGCEQINNDRQTIQHSRTKKQQISPGPPPEMNGEWELRYDLSGNKGFQSTLNRKKVWVRKKRGNSDNSS